MFKNRLISLNLVAGLARSYHPLHSRKHLEALLHRTSASLKDEFITPPSPHKLINDILINHYKGECILKALLVEKFIKSKVIAAFEIRVNSSRADFLTINGDSKSFEIKSELDNLSKLAKQVSDYEKVFDFNYIVIDKRHYDKAFQLIPSRYGILLSENGKLIEKKKGQPNNRHDSPTQLSLFSKKEFLEAFPIPGISKEEVIANFTDEEINTHFKEMLKKRYAKRWAFLVSNAKSINPIDYQFFFQHNLAPEIIYGP
jgi:hypothetical protein